MAGSKPKTVTIRNAGTGLLEEVRVAEAREKIRAGYKVATPEQIRKAELEEQYGGLGNELLAAGVGAARGLTAGLSDVVLTEGAELIAGKTTAENIRTALRNYRDVNPNASMAGEVGGTLLGLSKIMSPARAIAAAGEGAEALVLGGRAAAEVGAARAVGGAVARGVVEGGLAGAGMGLSEGALEGDISAERVVAAAGLGAVLGGGIGGAISAGGRALSAGARRLQNAMNRPGADAATRLLERATGEAAAPGVGGRIADVWASTAELAGVEGTTALRELGAMNRAGREARRWATQADDIIGRESSRAASSLAEAQSSLRSLGDDFAPKLKGDVLEQAILARVPADTLAAARSQAGRVAARLEELSLSGAKGTAKIAAAARSIQEKLAGTTKLGEAMTLLGELRQGVQRGAKAAPELGELAGGIRGVLENEALWGGAARLQQQVGAVEGARKALEDVLGVVPDAATGVLGVPESRIRSLLERPRSEGGLAAIAGYKAALAKGEGFVTQALESGALDDATRQTLEGYGKAITTAKEAIGNVELAAARREQLAKLTGADSLLLAGVAGAAGLAAGGDGDLSGIAPLAVLGAAVANPGRAVRQLAALESLAGRVAGRLGAAPGRLVRVAGAARKAVTWSALELNDRRSREKAVQTILAADPARAAEDARARLAAVGGAAPNVVEAAAAVAARATAYLQQHAPKPTMRAGVVLAPRIQPSDYALEVFERRRRAVHQPLTLLGDVERGRLTHEAVDAVRNVYPGLYDQMRMSYLAELAELGDKGKSLPPNQVAALEVLLGTPIEGINSPEVVAAIQASYEPVARPGPPPRRPPPDVSKFYKASSDALLETAA